MHYHSRAWWHLVRCLTDLCKRADTNSQSAFYSYQHTGLTPLVDTIQIFPWRFQVPVLDTPARTFRLPLEELWSWYPAVNVFVTILVLLTLIGGLYTVTSAWGVFPEPLQAHLSALPSATTQCCWNKGTAVPVCWQQAYTHLLCFSCCLVLTVRGRGFASSDFSFLKIWLSDLFLQRVEADRHFPGKTQPSLRDESHRIWFIPGGSRGIKNWVICYCLSFAFRKGDWRKEVAPGLRLHQQSLSREALSTEECPPSHLVPIHQSTLLPNPQGTAVPELQNRLLQACVGKREMQHFLTKCLDTLCNLTIFNLSFSLSSCPLPHFGLFHCCLLNVFLSYALIVFFNFQILFFFGEYFNLI